MSRSAEVARQAANATTIDMRALTLAEARVIRWFADQVGESRGLRLEDLEDTMVEEIRDEHFTLRFQKRGHPPSSFIDSYLGPCAAARDADGANLTLTLWLNLDGSPFELRVRRLETGPVQRPDWASLRSMTPEEFARLLELSDAADSAT